MLDCSYHCWRQESHVYDASSKDLDFPPEDAGGWDLGGSTEKVTSGWVTGTHSNQACRVRNCLAD